MHFDWTVLWNETTMHKSNAFAFWASNVQFWSRKEAHPVRSHTLLSSVGCATIKPHIENCGRWFLPRYTSSVHMCFEIYLRSLGLAAINFEAKSPSNNFPARPLVRRANYFSTRQLLVGQVVQYLNWQVTCWILQRQQLSRRLLIRNSSPDRFMLGTKGDSV